MSKTRLSLVPLVFALALANPLAAAQGGFQPGELALYNPALKGLSGDGGVARIDPTTGQVTTIALFPGGALQQSGSIAYDPYRDRLIIAGSTANNNPLRLWLIDSVGNLTDLGVTITQVGCFAPGAGGRIYFKRTSGPTPIRYLDAANQEQFLMDAAGTQPYAPPSVDLRGMIYHTGLNALFVVIRYNATWTCSGDGNTSVYRLRLSNDGARVLSVDACASIPVEPNKNTLPVGISMRPDGQLLLVIDTNSNLQLPRMSLLNPVSMAVTPFASNGPGAGAPSTSAGTWSFLLNKAVVFDTGNDVLRAFAQNEVGGGTEIVPSEMISAAASAGEITTLIEIPMGGCSPLVGTYCTAKTSSQGCTPAISASGCPSASAPSGFTLTAGPVPPTNLGILFYGKSGPAALPFQGAFMCVGSPIRRTPATSAGGAGACSGQYSIDFNAYTAAGSDPQLVAGAVVHGQFWFRDPPHPINGTGLSNGVTFTLAP